MNLTNGDIFIAQEPLKNLIEQKFPVMVSYKLAKLVSKLNDQLKVIEEVRNGLVKKYGVKDEREQLSVKPDSPNWSKFVIEFEELMAQETEIVIDKVKLPDKDLDIEPKILIALDKFVEV